MVRTRSDQRLLAAAAAIIAWWLACLPALPVMPGGAAALRFSSTARLASAAEPSRAASDQFNLAASYYSQKRWREAAEEFRSFGEQFPDDPRSADALFYEAEALMQQEQFQQAHDRFALLAEKNPSEAIARRTKFRLGETLYLTGNRAAAKTELLQFQQQFPDDPMLAFALPYLAEIALAEGDPARASELFSQTLDKYASGPLSDECRLGLGKALAAENQTEQAGRFFDYLIDRKGALADDAQYWKADALRRSGAAETTAAYERLAADWPQSDWLDDGLHGQIQWAISRTDFAAVDRLVEQFQERFAESPLAVGVARMHGKSLLQRGEYEKAAKVFQSLAQTPGRDELTGAQDAYFLAIAFLGQGDYEQARAATAAIDVKGLSDQVAGQLHSVRGAALAGLKDYQAAAEELGQSLKLHPTSADADRRRAQWAVALTSAGQLDQAEQVLREWNVSPQARDLWTSAVKHFAETAYAQGDAARAETWFSKVVDGPGSATAEGGVEQAAASETPNEANGAPEAAAEGVAGGDAAALSGLGWSQWRKGQYDASAATFERLAEEHPDHALAPEAVLMQAKSLEKLGRASLALSAFQTLIDRYPQAAERPEAMLSGALLIAAGAENAAEEDSQDGQEDIEHKRRAASLLEQVVEEFPEFARRDAALYEWAWLLEDIGDHAAGAAAFARLHNEHAESEYWADATYRVAERAARNKDYAGAVAALDRLLAASSDSEIRIHAWFLKGQIAAAEERWADVAPPLLELLAAAPDHSLALPAEFWVAESLFHTEEYGKASQRFAALAEKAAGRDDAWLPMIPLRQAQMLAREKKWAEAYELATGIAEQFPQFRQLYEVDYLLGRCLGKRGEFAAARNAYERVIRSPEGGRTETAAMAQWMIGESYFHQRRYDEAIKAYDRVVALFDWPNWQAGALLQAGKCHEIQGDRAEAEKLYVRLLKDFPDTPFSGEAASRLGKKQAGGGKPKSGAPVAQASASEPQDQ